MAVIYKVTNSVNNRVYVGFTIDFLKRKREHESCIERDSLFHQDLIRYGVSNFTWEIVEESTDSEYLLKNREKFYIEQFKSHQKHGGYNMTMGGQGALGRVVSDGTREKMSSRKKRAQPSRAKEYEVTSPSGEISLIKNLKLFCQRHLLNAGCMSGVARGKYPSHKGWKCVLVSALDVKVPVVSEHHRMQRRKQYLIQSPSGEEFIVNNIKDFCSKRRLNVSCMYSLASRKRRSYKQWKCQLVESHKEN